MGFMVGAIKFYSIINSDSNATFNTQKNMGFGQHYSARF